MIMCTNVKITTMIIGIHILMMGEKDGGDKGEKEDKVVT